MYYKLSAGRTVEKDPGLIWNEQEESSDQLLMSAVALKGAEWHVCHP